MAAVVIYLAAGAWIPSARSPWWDWR